MSDLLRNDLLLPAAACAIAVAVYVEATSETAPDAGPEVRGFNARRAVTTLFASLVLVYFVLWCFSSGSNSTISPESIAIRNIQVGDPGF